MTLIKLIIAVNTNIHPTANSDVSADAQWEAELAASKQVCRLDYCLTDKVQMFACGCISCLCISGILINCSGLKKVRLTIPLIVLNGNIPIVYSIVSLSNLLAKAQ